MQTYQIFKDDHTIRIIVEKYLVPENTEPYISDFSKMIENINIHDYDLYIDGTKYIITPLNMQDTLRKHLKRFKELGFKKITIKIGDKKILKLQACRIAKEAGLDNIEIL